jgi:hypothetical protein
MVVGIRAPKIVALYVKECTKGVPQAARSTRRRNKAKQKDNNTNIPGTTTKN